MTSATTAPPRLDIGGAIRPLRLIFWGGLICVFDITISQTTNGQGFRFDILNDAVGFALIAIGVFALARFAPKVDERYRAWMLLCQILSVIAVGHAALEHIVFRHPPPLSLLLGLIDFANLIGIVAFCVAMRWLSERAELDDAAASWRTTSILFSVIYLVPLGLVYATATVATVTGSSFNVDLGPLGLVVLPVFAVPLIHLFVSTSRMARDARDGGSSLA